MFQWLRKLFRRFFPKKISADALLLMKENDPLTFYARKLYSLVELTGIALSHQDISQYVECAYRTGDATFMSPAEAFSRFLWEKIESAFEDWDIRPRFVDGHLGMQRHWWYEIELEDLRWDPLPRIYIIDPAAVGLSTPLLLVEPSSPFRALYRRD